jgi:hypothetical protein
MKGGINMDRPGYFRFSKMMNSVVALRFWFNYFSCQKRIPCFVAKHPRADHIRPIGYTLWRQGIEATEVKNLKEKEDYSEGEIIKQWPEPRKEVQNENSVISAR